MRKKERYQHILDYFSRTMGQAESELNFNNAFELVVAVVLSAQCTDKRINMITPELFRLYPTAEAMAAASEEAIFESIKSVSYPHNKARHLSRLSQMLMSEFNGEVPDTLEELTRLPGVGRKTAGVVLAVWFGKSALPVDTHVFRVSHRLGLVPKTCTTPSSVEKSLRTYIPDELTAAAHHWFLLHGRYVCTARRPSCSKCGLKDICNSKDKNQN